MSAAADERTLLVPADDVATSDVLIADDAECRVCRLSASLSAPLCTPCLCRGSIAYIHESCLLEWLTHTRSTKCELCSYQFEFQPIYHPQAPNAPSISDITVGTIKRLRNALPSINRILICSSVWLYLVPLITYYIAIICIHQTLPTLSRTLYESTKHAEQGFLVCISIFAVSGTVVGFRELMKEVRDEVEIEERIGERQDGHDQNEEDNVQEDVQVEELQQAAHALIEAPQPLPRRQAAPINPEVPAPAVAAAVDEDGAFANPDDIPLANWIGLAGPIHYFLVHVASILIYNTLFLISTLAIPLILSKLTYSIINISPRYVSLAILRIIITDHNSRITYTTLHDAVHLDTIVSCLTGYFLLLIVLVIWSYSLPFLSFIRSAIKQLILAIKIIYLLTLKLIIFPILLGIIIDISTLCLLTSTIQHRYLSLLKSPHIFILVHLGLGIGFLCVISFIVSILKKCVRKIILSKLLGSFLRSHIIEDNNNNNANNANHNNNQHFHHPFRELITVSLYTHIFSIIRSTLFYIVLIIICIHIPIKLCIRLIPSITPFTLRWSEVHEAPIDMVLFQFAIPIAMERLDIRSAVVMMVKTSIRLLSEVLGIDKIIMNRNEGALVVRNNDAPHHHQHEEDNNHAAAPLINRDGEVVDVGADDVQVSHYTLRMFVLLLSLWMIYTAQFVLLLASVMTTGRIIVSWTRQANSVHHDMYALVAGFYLCVGVIFLLVKGVHYIGARDVRATILIAYEWSIITCKVLFLAVFVLIIIPFLTGLLVVLSVITPLRIAADATLMHVSMYECIGIGLIVLQFIYRLLYCGYFPDTNIWKRKLDQLQRQGLANLSLIHVMTQLVIPILSHLALHLALPYVAGALVVYVFEHTPMIVQWEADAVAAIAPMGPLTIEATVDAIDFHYLHAINALRIRRWAFLVGLLVRVAIFAIQCISAWFAWLKKTTYEERWLVGKKLKNIKTVIKVNTPTPSNDNTLNAHED